MLAAELWCFYSEGAWTGVKESPVKIASSGKKKERNQYRMKSGDLL